MSTSAKTFDQVKSILGKLDRNIDAVRERRLGDHPVKGGPSMGLNGSVPIGAAMIPPHASTQLIGLPSNHSGNGLNGSGAPRAFPAPIPVQPAAPINPNGKSGYGRAQPLRRENGAA